VRAAICIVLGSVSLLFLAVNYALLVAWLRSDRTRSESFLPIVGGLLGMAAMLAWPGGALVAWCWIPLVLDLTISSLVVGSILWVTRRVLGKQSIR